MVCRLLDHLDFSTRGVDALIGVDLLECAHILSRSSMETTAKLIYIGLQEDAKREEIALELAEKLGEIYNRRNKLRADQAENSAQEHGDKDSSRVYRYISTSDEIKLSKLTKKERQEIEQRWAFTSIVGWADKRFGELGLRIPMSTLLYDYGMSSHLLHADGIGLDLELDQQLRHPEEGELKQLAEGCKLYTTLCSCWLKASLTVLIMQNVSRETISKPMQNFDVFIESTKPFVEDFFRSQDEFYQSFGY